MYNRFVLLLGILGALASCGPASSPARDAAHDAARQDAIHQDVTPQDATHQDVESVYLASLKQPITPDNTIFAFDLHDVLFKRKIGTIAWQCLKVLPRGMFWYLFNYHFWSMAWPIINEPSIWEVKFKKLTALYPDLNRFRDDFMIMSNAVYPIDDSINLLRQLKSKGYKLFLLSNIGAETYEDHKRRQPEVMALFDGVYLPGPENGYVRKPDVAYYEGYLTYLKALGYADLQTLFIDDLIENLDGAIKLGIAGIRFRSTDQVKETLERLRI